MRTIIAGSRGIHQGYIIEQAILSSGWYDDITEVVSGNAQGVDRAGEWWAHRNGVELTVMPANWEAYGKRAGVLRNAEMAAYADRLIAVWDGESRGTRNMIETARSKGMPVHVVLVLFPEAGDPAGQYVLAPKSNLEEDRPYMVVPL